jgi:hypothetical protein
MPIVSENSKRPGVLYCFTESGVELPVVDITNPAFVLDVDEATLPQFADQQVRSMKAWSRVPSILRAWFARNSVLMGSSDRGGVLDGMTTYLYKLGPENLGAGYTKRMDRRVAANIMAVAVRLRFRDIVRMTAGALLTRLAADDRPLHLLNLAGGTGMDSLNALVLVRKESVQMLLGRAVVIHLLDPDRAGFSFATRALAALSQDAQAPLHGLDVELIYGNYDWADASSLSAAVHGIRGAGDRRDAGKGGSAGPISMATSEGGLFEYGSDEEILQNLTILCEDTPRDFVVVGSALKDEPITHLMKKMSGTSFIPRTLEDLATLVSRAGWSASAVAGNNPVYHVVTLRKCV